MQTFLPYPDFVQSADVLDWEWTMNRLNNQINEGIVVANTLFGVYDTPTKKGSWWNHPTVLEWEGHEFFLVDYLWNCLYTWKRKKKKLEDLRGATLLALQAEATRRLRGKEPQKPWWLGDERFHSSHRAVLLGKNYNYYKQFGWLEEPAQKGPDGRWPYFWPVTKEGEKRHVS